MAYQIVWTHLARSDLKQVVEYIVRDNPEAGLRVGEQILKSVEILGTMPRAGRVVPERDDDAVREIIRGNYRIVYRIVEDRKRIEIWRVWHGARGPIQFLG